jgi:hypothetical protein
MRERQRRRLAMIAVFVVFAMLAAFVIASFGSNGR